MHDHQAIAAIAANVRRLRGRRTRAHLAKEVGCHQQQIYRIEAAETQPLAGFLARLAAALGVTTDELLTVPTKIPDCS